MCWFALRTFTGLSQYPVFKVQAAADFPRILRFCPLHAATSCFGGEEIHYSFTSTVSTTRRNIFPTDSLSTRNARFRRCKNASQSFRKALAAQHVCRVTAASMLLCERLRTAFRFQHALRSQSAPAVRQRRIPPTGPLRNTTCEASCRYPERGPRTHPIRAHRAAEMVGSATAIRQQSLERQDARSDASPPEPDDLQPAYARSYIRLHRAPPRRP